MQPTSWPAGCWSWPVPEPTVKPSDSLPAAVDRMAADGRGLAVVTKSGRVVGTVTDAQVRRAVLAGHSLDEAVETVMSRKPVTVAPRAPAKAVLELLHAHRL